MKGSQFLLPCFLISLISFSVGFAASGFSDVSDEDWYADSVLNLADMGIVEGYTDGRYGAADFVNRAEMATILDRTLSMLKEEACVDGENIYFDGDVIDRGDYICHCDQGEVGMCTGEVSE